MKEYSQRPEINMRVCDPIARQAGLREAADFLASLYERGHVSPVDIRTNHDRLSAGVDLEGRPLTRRTIARTFETVDELKRTPPAEAVQTPRSSERGLRLPVVKIRKVRRGQAV